MGALWIRILHRSLDTADCTPSATHTPSPNSESPEPQDRAPKGTKARSRALTAGQPGGLAHQFVVSSGLVGPSEWQPRTCLVSFRRSRPVLSLRPAPGPVSQRPGRQWGTSGIKGRNTARDGLREGDLPRGVKEILDLAAPLLARCCRWFAPPSLEYAANHSVNDGHRPSFYRPCDTQPEPGPTAVTHAGAPGAPASPAPRARPLCAPVGPRSPGHPHLPRCR